MEEDTTPQAPQGTNSHCCNNRPPMSSHPNRIKENNSPTHPCPLQSRLENNSNDKRQPIGVVGTGNAAIAITKRLISSGYSVIMGSRKPLLRHSTLTQLGHCLCGAQLTSITECIRQCDVIIVAIHMENFRVTLAPYSLQTRGKIIVDISNRETRYVSRSNSEYLASILPEAEVVKAFNTISASVMENSLDLSVERQKVFVACDDEKTRNKILDLARAMGFHVVDFGRLENSRQIEDFVLKVFSHWKVPIFLTFGIFNLWALYIVYIYFIKKTAYEWEQIFLKILNKPICMTAMTTFALTYLPGQIASIVQVYRGTKHSRFPRILDTWLKSRKQFGLITFGLVCFHVIASTLMLSPTYYKSWFHQPTVSLPLPVRPTAMEISQNLTMIMVSSSSASSLTSIDVVTTTIPEVVSVPVSSSWMVWKGELALLFGILAFLAMCVQAVTSINSVAASLNWSEWRCVQTNMGTFVLILAACHVFSMGVPGWIKVGPKKMVGSITFLSLILPMLVLFLKFLFRFTPLYCYLSKIRKGWERGGSAGGDVEMRNLKMGKLHNSHNNQHYEPLSNVKAMKHGSTCGIDDKEEDRVRLTMGSPINGGADNFESNGKKVSKSPCCCSGKQTLNQMDTGSKCGLKNTVRFASDKNCDCSFV